MLLRETTIICFNLSVKIGQPKKENRKISAYPQTLFLPLIVSATGPSPDNYKKEKAIIGQQRNSTFYKKRTKMSG